MSDENERKIADAIAELRKAARMSATALAEELGMQAKTVRAYENGVLPGPQRLFALAILADMILRDDLYWIFVGELRRLLAVAPGWDIEVKRPEGQAKEKVQ